MTDRVRDYLAAQQAALAAGERLVATGDRAGVHPSRVAVRRTRSTLRTFAVAVPEELRLPFDEALQSHALQLGEVRDLEVLAQVLETRADGPLADWIDEHLDGELDRAWGQVRAALAQVTPGELQALFTTTLAAMSPVPQEELVQLAARAGKRAGRKLRRAGDDPELLHEARKAAKRARYAAEVIGDAEAAARFERLQGVLGDHRDLVMARAWLRDAPVPAALAHEAHALDVRLAVGADAVLELRIP